MTVDPVKGAASEQLRMILLGVLYQQLCVSVASGKAAAAREKVNDSGVRGLPHLAKGGVGDGNRSVKEPGNEEAEAAVSEAVLMLQMVVEARMMLRSIIKGGNANCGDRWGGGGLLLYGTSTIAQSAAPKPLAAQNVLAALNGFN